MDLEHYQQLKHYIITGTYFPDMTSQQQKRIKVKAKYYEVKDNILYKKDRKRKGKLLKSLLPHEIYLILYAVHNYPTGAHFGTD